MAEASVHGYVGTTISLSRGHGARQGSKVKLFGGNFHLLSANTWTRNFTEDLVLGDIQEDLFPSTKMCHTLE